MTSSMRDNAAKVADDFAETGLFGERGIAAARRIAAAIRALPIKPDPTRAALEAIARDMPFRGPNGVEDYSAAYSRLKQMARNALQED